MLFKSTIPYYIKRVLAANIRYIIYLDTSCIQNSILYVLIRFLHY